MLANIIKDLEKKMLADHYAQWGIFLRTPEAKQGDWVYNEVTAFLLDNNYSVGADILFNAYPSLAGNLNILVTRRLNTAYAYFEQHIKNDLKKQQLQYFKNLLERTLHLLLPETTTTNKINLDSLPIPVYSAIQHLFQANDISMAIFFEIKSLDNTRQQSSIDTSKIAEIDAAIEKLQTIIEQRKAEQLKCQKITETHGTVYTASRANSDDLCSLACTIT